jgi:hypothetical protein
MAAVSEGWAVALVGEDFDLDVARLNLRGPFDTWVEDYRVDGTSVLLLRSRGWSDMLKAREMLADADRLVTQINAIALLEQSDACPLTLGMAFRFDGNGKSLPIIVAAAGQMTITGGRVRFHTVSIGAPLAMPAPSRMQDRLERAAETDSVADLLTFITRADNWFDLFKAMESLESLIPGKAHGAKKRFADWDRTRRTANYARHSPTKQEPLPPNPPTLDEARQILLAAVNQII